MKALTHPFTSLLIAAAIATPSLAFAHAGHDHEEDAVHAEGAASVKGESGSMRADAHAGMDAHADSGPNGLLNLKNRLFLQHGASSSKPEHSDMRHEDKGKIPEKVQGWAEGAIDARVAALTRAEDRVDAAVKLSAGTKASIKANLSTAISALTELKGKITSDTSIADLKADASSIGKDFRVYVLVLPQAAIAAGSDRALALVSQFEALSVKFDARIDAAADAGEDVTSLRRALADFDDHVVDAKADAQAAASLVADIDPNGGNAATFEANMTALKNAHAKLESARKNLKEAEANARTIVGGVKGKGSVEASVRTN